MRAAMKLKAAERPLPWGSSHPSTIAERPLDAAFAAAADLFCS